MYDRQPYRRHSTLAGVSNSFRFSNYSGRDSLPSSKILPQEHYLGTESDKDFYQGTPR